MKEIFLLLLTIIIIFIVSEVIAAYLANFIIFSDSNKEKEEKEEKEHIAHDIFFVCIKRNMNASDEAGYDSFGFRTQEDAEAYKQNLIQDGIPEEDIKIERERK